MSLLKRSTLMAATVTGLSLALAGPAAAHVTVNPNTATPGGFTVLGIRVPNESDTADTTKIEVNLPVDVAPLAFVSVKPVPGWTAVAVKSKLAKPLEAHGSQITEAISKITWTAQPGAAVKPGQYQQFDVSVGPLPESGQMIFKALQTYSDGTVVRWIDEPAAAGAAEPEHPAPVLKLAAAPAAGAAALPATQATADKSSDSNGFGIAGLIAGLVALLLSAAAFIRAGRRPTAASPSGAAAQQQEPAARS